MAFTTDNGLCREGPHVPGGELSVVERARIIKSHLPDRPRAKKRPAKQKPRPIRTFLKSQFYYLIYFLIHIFFSIYIRFRASYHAVVDRILAILYYHHRTPELIQKDVQGLSQLPEHLSVVLTLKRQDDALEVLMDEVAELTAWSSCAGIPLLSIYEKTGKSPSLSPLRA